MKLDIFKEILLKINNELNIDGEYQINADELGAKFNIKSLEELKGLYYSLYSRDKFYDFEDEITLENPFLIRIDLINKSLIFQLNTIWKRKLFFKGKSISESLMEIWNILIESEPTYASFFDLLGENDDDFSILKKTLKKAASLKGGHNQMVIIGLIERADDILELEKLAVKYDLSDNNQTPEKKLDAKTLTFEEYKNELRLKVNTYPSYKRMSLLGFINRAASKEELANIFNKESIDEGVMKRVGDSFNEKREKRKEIEKIELVLNEEDQEFESLKSEVRQKVMKMSTFNKMTILGYISRASNKNEILDLIEKYQIK